MVARRIASAFRGARVFDCLMSRFSTPDDIFGPVSIGQLKTSDTYERKTEGYMPEADVAFLDEIWKAGPAILNSLLTIINERTYRNGTRTMRVPLKLLIGASNELPATGEGLEALWDRFIVRMVSRCVEDETNFYHIIAATGDEVAPPLPTPLTITAKEYAAWQKEIDKIGIDTGVLKGLTHLRDEIRRLRVGTAGDDATAQVRSLYVSDRRWKRIVHLMRASAFMNGRERVGMGDMLLLPNCLWNEPDEITPLRGAVLRTFFVGITDETERLQELAGRDRQRRAIARQLRRAIAENDHGDDDKELFDKFYYRIDLYGSGNTYIVMSEYHDLPRYTIHRNGVAADGVVYTDPHNPKRSLMSTYISSETTERTGEKATRVKLMRDADGIYINGARYPMHKMAAGQSRPVIGEDVLHPTDSCDYHEAIETLVGILDSLMEEVRGSNMLVSTKNMAAVEREHKNVAHKIALLRASLQEEE